MKIKLLISFFVTLSLFAKDYPDRVKPRSFNIAEAPALALAKEMCSCLFVSEQPIEYCRSVTKESRILAKYKVNFEKKEVEAKVFTYKAYGSFNKEKPQFGCKISRAYKKNRYKREWHDLADYEYWQEYKREEQRRRLRRRR